MSILHAEQPSEYTVRWLCGLLGLSTQAYYKHDEDAAVARAAQEEFVLQFIRGVRSRDRGIGGLKLWHMYRATFGANRPVGRDRFSDIVAKYGLKVRKKARKPRTTDSTHGLPVYPNLIRDFIPTRPNELWVSDITYIPIVTGRDKGSFCYLSLVLDAYTEEIVGWSVGPTLSSEYPLKALRMALERLGGKSAAGGLIHHSDRGVQYASSSYVALLRRNGIRVSMTESGNPKDNPQAERINNTIKNEMFMGVEFHSVREVAAAMADAVDFYNNERPHMSIDMMTPAEAAQRTGEVKKHWKSWRLLAIKNKLEKDGDGENALSLPGSQGPTSGLRPPVGP